MGREYTTFPGSGTTPALAYGPPHSLPENTFPVPSQRESLRTLQGDGSVILNPEDFSVSIGLSTSAVTVGGVAVALPANPLEFRRALVVHNNGNDTVYLGDSSVTTNSGLPLAAGEKIAFDIQNNQNVTVYAISSSSVNVRLMELA